ncbi:MAG: hypothetical protein GC134_03500 [Proteobacteria bacterium]|nr:hypothetical protein [Pseudomonadota bacterium]
MILLGFCLLLMIGSQLGFGGYAGYSAFTWAFAAIGGGAGGWVLGILAGIVAYAVIGMIAGYIAGWISILLGQMFGYSSCSFSVSFPLGANIRFSS